MPPHTQSPSPSEESNAANLSIIYDGDCPFCSAYVKMTRLKQAAGKVELINARDGGPLVEEAQTRGLDLNEGMAMKWGDNWYHGDEVIHQLALMTSRSGLFNKLMAATFRSPARAKFLYPFLRAGRNTALLLLGRKKI